MRNLLRAMLWALVWTSILVLLCFLVVLAWGHWIGYPSDAKASDVKLIQLGVWTAYAGFAAIFLGITLGFFAFREFSQREERARLRLQLGAPDIGFVSGELVIRVGSETTAQFSLAIINDGSVIGVWYVVEFHAPFLAKRMEGCMRRTPEPTLEEAFDCVLDQSFTAVAGERGRHWKRSRWNPARRTGDFVFQSEGTVPAYSGWPNVLCSFLLPIADCSFRGDQPVTWPCGYRITADRGRIEEGSLSLRVERRGPGH